ncbi:MAG: SH3 domain-containing protein [Clostridiales bacterium]|jgi:uncharacterized protein YraI|nr:SH3 domain-containing protein [Clostridiales bacterium]
MSLKFFVKLTGKFIIAAGAVLTVWAAAPKTILADDLVITGDNVHFRAGPSTSAGIISTLRVGTQVSSSEDNDGWSLVSYNGQNGYIIDDYLRPAGQGPVVSASGVELTPWSEAKGVFTVGKDALIVDVRTGAQYYVRSFSNGNHADVEPVTEQDTQIMLSTYGGRWEWDPRPVWVTINGRTMAASINGMPHGGGVNHHNGMNGQVCIHFKGSKTHNGNVSFEHEHQAAVDEAFRAAQ